MYVKNLRISLIKSNQIFTCLLNVYPEIALKPFSNKKKGKIDTLICAKTNNHKLQSLKRCKCVLLIQKFTYILELIYIFDTLVNDEIDDIYLFILFI